jgi:hypothetical protein
MINLIEKDMIKLPRARPRPLRTPELIVLKEMLTDLKKKGFIRELNSPVTSPIQLVAKSGGGVRFCVNYRKINDLIKKDRYPILLISDTIRTIAGSRFLTKLDISTAFYRVRIREGDE